jgi:hypothetical protein
MLNRVEKTLYSLLLLEEALLQEKIEQSKEISHKSQVSGKLWRRLGLLMQGKKDKYLRKQDRSSRGTKDTHLRPEIKEYAMPQAFDQSTSPREGKEVSKLIKFLYTCLKLIWDENVVQELQNLIRQYDLGKVDPLLNRVVH